MGAAATTIRNIVTECTTHKAFCLQWGVSNAELEGAPESAPTSAYGAYLIDVGVQGFHPTHFQRIRGLTLRAQETIRGS